jgi:hypothetical protein
VLIAAKVLQNLAPFFFDSRKMGQSLVRWSVLLPMIHAVRRFNCVQASATTTTTTGWAASLAVLIESLIEGPRVSFLRGCSKNFLPIFWQPTAVKITVVYWFGIASLCHCSEVLELCRALILSSAAQAYGNAGPQTCLTSQTVHRALTLFWAAL